MTLPKKFDPSWYDEDYFATPEGKKFRRPSGSVEGWSYANPTGEFTGAGPITKAWKEIFSPVRLLDVGGGRGTFAAYARDVGIEAYCMDFSRWALQNPYPRCRFGWLQLADAAYIPFRDDSFDLVTCLDTMEHIYLEDVDRVIDEVYRVSSRYVFFEIACVLPKDYGTIIDPGYALRKGEPVPIELECVAVAGHVTVQRKEWWIDRLEREDWWLRRDLEEWFRALVPGHIIKNWNTLFICEHVG